MQQHSLFDQKIKTQPSLLVIFGATGDLTHRKLLPALYHLYRKNKLPAMAIVAVARRDKSHEDYRADARISLAKFVKEIDKKTVKSFLSHIYYYQQDFDNDQGYSELKHYLATLDQEYNTQGNRIFYLATLPMHFGYLVNHMKQHHYLDRSSQAQYRIIIEKPFGTDLASANELNKILKSLFHEEEIYRIDHYLGKETVQNLFALRFANRIFEAVWNAQHIENIQITVAESLGVGTRGGYYENAGAIRDMVQNHLLQILMLVAMEPPRSFTPQAIKDEKIKVLKHLLPLVDSSIEKNVVFGQYSKSNNKKGYREEERVNPHSHTETFVALKAQINNERWKGMPFYLRTGKHLKTKISEVDVYFKDTSVSVFQQRVKHNVLVIKLQPDEGVYMRFNIKKPGTAFNIERVSMDFCHDCLFEMNTPEAYEKLLFDAINNDPTLFTRWDEVEQAWKYIDPITAYWNASKKQPVFYEAGSWGPKEADDLLKRENHHWRLRKDK